MVIVFYNSEVNLLKKNFFVGVIGNKDLFCEEILLILFFDFEVWVGIILEDY